MTKPIQVYRGGYLESTHDVHIAIVDTKGNLKYSYGDPSRLTFPRSALKPFQAISLIESGAAEHFSFTDEEIAVSCASHSGEEIHRSTVLGMMEKINIKESDLYCGPQIPKDIEGYKTVIRNGGDVSPVFNNCSGKHTGMIAASLYLNESPKTYYELSHPLQQRIIDIMADVFGMKREDIEAAIDGCGLPTHYLPLKNFALGFARLARPDQLEDMTHRDALERIRNSMMAHPRLVAGKDRFDTDVMKVLKGKLVSKMGAEGMQGIGLVEEGLGIAIKVEDGNDRGAYVAAMKVLEQLNILDKKMVERLLKYEKEPIFNTVGEKVGEITAEFTLNKHED
ncbi:asparaginase [Bacilli bacterium]|nr:L-asparaginase [Bacilli bacterium VT-13-104]PZD81438.1 asparaginase [Bacilli bacterium]PZD84003.1 asparaginase [Bacilli bacterium]PZD85927.1 asparaginase [Bacilli bacterium]RCO04431.1 asparaginase [Bacilli bacterium]